MSNLRKTFTSDFQNCFCLSEAPPEPSPSYGPPPSVSYGPPEGAATTEQPTTTESATEYTTTAVDFQVHISQPQFLW